MTAESFFPDDFLTKYVEERYGTAMADTCKNILNEDYADSRYAQAVRRSLTNEIDARWLRKQAAND